VVAASGDETEGAGAQQRQHAIANMTLDR